MGAISIMDAGTIFGTATIFLCRCQFSQPILDLSVTFVKWGWLKRAIRVTEGLTEGGQEKSEPEKRRPFSNAPIVKTRKRSNGQQPMLKIGSTKATSDLSPCGRGQKRVVKEKGALRMPLF
eukprot:scaffold517_cov119-Cylindrotheca_fusiformis.AAC.39